MFKIKIEVKHENMIRNFVFWDNECISYDGMSTHDLRQLMKQLCISQSPM